MLLIRMKSPWRLATLIVILTMMSAAETAAELTDECRENEEEREQIDEWLKKATAGTGSRV